MIQDKYIENFKSDGEVNKIPYMLIVDEKEENDKTLFAGEHSIGDNGIMAINETITLLNESVKSELGKS